MKNDYCWKCAYPTKQGDGSFDTECRRCGTSQTNFPDLRERYFKTHHDCPFSLFVPLRMNKESGHVFPELETSSFTPASTLEIARLREEDKALLFNDWFKSNPVVGVAEFELKFLDAMNCDEVERDAKEED